MSYNTQIQKRQKKAGDWGIQWDLRDTQRQQQELTRGNRKALSGSIVLEWVALSYESSQVRGQSEESSRVLMWQMESEVSLFCLSPLLLEQHLITSADFKDQEIRFLYIFLNPSLVFFAYTLP